MRDPKRPILFLLTGDTPCFALCFEIPNTFNSAYVWKNIIYIIHNACEIREMRLQTYRDRKVLHVSQALGGMLLKNSFCVLLVIRESHVAVNRRQKDDRNIQCMTKRVTPISSLGYYRSGTLIFLFYICLITCLSCTRF